MRFKEFLREEDHLPKAGEHYVFKASIDALIPWDRRVPDGLNYFPLEEGDEVVVTETKIHNRGGRKMYVYFDYNGRDLVSALATFKEYTFKGTYRDYKRDWLKNLKEEQTEPTVQEYIRQFRELKEHIISREYGATTITDIKPVIGAHGFWHDKSGVFLFLISMKAVWKVGYAPPDADEDHFTDVRYWVEWDPTKKKSQLVADFGEHQKVRLGGPLKDLADENPEIAKRIQAKAGRWHSLYIDWPADIETI